MVRDLSSVQWPQFPAYGSPAAHSSLLRNEDRIPPPEIPPDDEDEAEEMDGSLVSGGDADDPGDASANDTNVP